MIFKNFITTTALTFILSGYLSSAHAMIQEMDLKDSRNLVYLTSEDKPKNLSICSASSVSSYNNTDIGTDLARQHLDTSQFALVKAYEDPAAGFRVEAWEDKDGGNVVVSFRGTVPTSQNLLSDLAVTKFAAWDANHKEPMTYLRDHLETQVNAWKAHQYIPALDSVDMLVKYAPTTTFLGNLKMYGGTALGAMGGYGLATLPLSLTPFGASVFTGTAAYLTYQSLGGHYLDDQSTSSLVGVNQTALRWTNEFLTSYDTRKIDVVFSGHSLGGFVANTVAELAQRTPQMALLFNAPGGIQTFLSRHKKYLLGEKDDWFTWGKKVFVASQETFPHEWRGLSINVSRAHDIVGRVGGDNASRRSVLVPDFATPAPLPIAEYVLGNHGIFNLARDLHPEHFSEEK